MLHPLPPIQPQMDKTSNNKSVIEVCLILFPYLPTCYVQLVFTRAILQPKQRAPSKASSKKNIATTPSASRKRRSPRVGNVSPNVVDQKQQNDKVV
jgi:hypothetical protein